jgi:ADP-heptose:LPS heptosyltransferase
MTFKDLDKAIRSWNHRRIDFLRKFRLQITKKFFDHRKNVIPEKRAEKNILVFRLDDKLGDAVVSTGFLKSIKMSYRDHKLTVLAGPQTAAIYKTLPFIDEVVICKKNFGALFKVYSELKKRSYRYIVNTSHILSPRVVMLMSLLRGAGKIGFLNSDYKLFTATAQYDENKHHVLFRYRNLIELMGVEDPELQYVIQLNKDSVGRAAAALEAYKKAGQKIIVLNSFAGARLRNLSKETTSEIIKKLTQNGSHIVLSVANEGDHRILNEWRSGATVKGWLQLSDFHTLDDNVALLSLADLVITPDTAWVHLASALGRNLVAIYREDTEEKNSVIWAPAHPNAKVVTAPSTAENPFDINNVSIDEVLLAANSLLHS